MIVPDISDAEAGEEPVRFGKGASYAALSFMLSAETEIVSRLAPHFVMLPMYDSLYCARGQMENLIKLHKTQLASDRTSCRSAVANQVRLVLHTAAYWLMLDVRDAIPKPRDLAKAEFATLRLRLIKIAARVIETASRVRLAFAAGSPEADLFRSLPGALMPCGP